jgi:hypothetical protein
VLNRGNDLVEEYGTPLKGGFNLSDNNSKSQMTYIDGKLEKDEEDEMNIYLLEKELNEKRGMLDQAKFKYEQRQLYELNE